MHSPSKLSIYKGKKVFITGHTGFKGSWLVAWLHLLGATVKGYALAPEFAQGLYNCIEGDALCTSVIDDIRDEARLTQELAAFQPDFVFHLAAQPLVRFSYEQPTETFDVNVLGTAKLLHAVKSIDRQCAVVIITTDKVYENKEWLYPYREADALGGYDPYSASKACTELVVNSFRQSFYNLNNYDAHKKAIASARAGNVIGGGDWSKDRIVPDIVKSLQAGKNIIVRNPTAIRPWQFVLEPLLGYLNLGAALYTAPKTFSEAYNFGPFPNDFLSVGALVAQAVSVWGSGTVENAENKNQVHEAGILKLDISKAIDQLQWEPLLNASEAIAWTMEWYKKAPEDQQKFTFDQILKFQKLL